MCRWTFVFAWSRYYLCHMKESNVILAVTSSFKSHAKNGIIDNHIYSYCFIVNLVVHLVYYKSVVQSVNRSSFVHYSSWILVYHIIFWVRPAGWGDIQGAIELSDGYRRWIHRSFWSGSILSWSAVKRTSNRGEWESKVGRLVLYIYIYIYKTHVSCNDKNGQSNF